MAYRNGTYVAFDGNGTANPTESDLRYYSLLRAWNESEHHELTFSNSHEKTYQVRDTSANATLKARLLERMKNSKNMLLIISEDTNYNRGMLNFEIEKAVELYKIPLIIAYPGYKSVLQPKSHSKKWPEALEARVNNGSVKAIHIPFKQKPIFAAISQFSVNNQTPKSSLSYYSKEAYERWGLA